MKKIKSLLALATCVIAFTTCMENDPDVVNPPDGEPLVTSVGTPTGPSVTASIDAAGGTLSTADGTLQLTVPAGAVSAATIFSIEPISNHCPGGNGMAYRLLPEGTTFAQPVSLNFSYADSLVADEKFVGLAYQGADNTWFAPKVISLNETDNKISVQTKHFSDWSLFLRIHIEPFRATVKKDEEIELNVIFVGELNDITDSQGAEINNLYNMVENNEVSATWHAADGMILQRTAQDGIVTVEYTAPSAVPSPNPVEVSVTFNNVSFTHNGATVYNPQLKAYITVVGDEMFFLVKFTSSRSLQPVANNCFTETDAGSMKVSVLGDSVTVYDIINEVAIVDPVFLYDPDPECTYTLVSPGDGPYHVSDNVRFGGTHSSFDNHVYVGISTQTYSKGFTPSFQISCTGSSPTTDGGEELPTAPAQFSFDASKDYQEKYDTIPGGGFFPDGYLKIAVTKVTGG